MRQRLVTVERLESIARNAILGGYGQLVPWRDGSDAVHRVVRLTLNMDCDDPYGFELHARWSAFKGRKVDPFTIVGFARCRKCRPCKVRRRMFWAARAHTEYNRAVATMMVTFTTTLDQDFAWDQVLRSRYAHKWVDFDKDLSEPEKFTARASIFGEEITKYIKRLRKGDSDHPKPALRYLLIAEAHDSDATSVEKKGTPAFFTCCCINNWEVRLCLGTHLPLWPQARTASGRGDTRRTGSVNGSHSYSPAMKHLSGPNGSLDLRK